MCAHLAFALIAEFKGSPELAQLVDYFFVLQREQSDDREGLAPAIGTHEVMKDTRYSINLSAMRRALNPRDATEDHWNLHR